MGNFPEPWDWAKLQSKMLLDWENFGEIGYINAEHESDFRQKLTQGWYTWSRTWSMSMELPLWTRQKYTTISHKNVADSITESN